LRQKKEKENGKNRLNFMMIRLFLVFINTQFLKDTFKHQGLRKQLVSILKNKGINDKFRHVGGQISLNFTEICVQKLLFL